MRVLKKENITEIAEALKQGAVVIFPTETSYGMGCDAANQEAVDRIFLIKNRPRELPLLVIVPTIAKAKECIEWNSEIERLALKFWPGALTVVGKCVNKKMAKGVISKNNTLAVRVTASPWLNDLCARLGSPLVATSANLSGQEEIYDSKQVKKVFENNASRPDIIVDAGEIEKNIPSTVVDASGNQLSVIRQGAVSIYDV